MNTDDMLPEPIARSVLARATQIDAQSPAVSVDELRAIAAELNVSEAAFNTALKEHETVTVDSPAVRRRASMAVAVLGVPIGLAGGVLLSTATPFTAPSIWFLLSSAGLLSSTGLIVLQSKRPSVGSYVLQNSVLWGGITVGSLSALTVLGGGVAGASPWLIALLYGIKHWVPSTILGSAGVTAVLRADSAQSGDSGEPLLASTSAERDHVRTRAERVLKWLKARFTTQFATVPGAILRRTRPAPAPGAPA
jgi:hypothetical protein